MVIMIESQIFFTYTQPARQVSLIVSQHQGLVHTKRFSHTFFTMTPLMYFTYFNVFCEQGLKNINSEQALKNVRCEETLRTKTFNIINNLCYIDTTTRSYYDNPHQYFQKVMFSCASVSMSTGVRWPPLAIHHNLSPPPPTDTPQSSLHNSPGQASTRNNPPWTPCIHPPATHPPTHTPTI